MTQCTYCGGYIAAGRWQLGYRTCLECGEQDARQVTRTVAPMHKSNYMLITDMHDLEGLNNKGGLVR